MANWFFKALTLPGEIRLDPVDHLGGLPPGHEVGVVDVGDPAAAAVAHAHLARVLRAALGPLLVEVGLDQALDLLRGLVGHDADGELAWKGEDESKIVAKQP